MRHVDQRRVASARCLFVLSSFRASFEGTPVSYTGDGQVRDRTAHVMCAGAMPKSARGSDIRLVPNLDRSVALGTRMLIRSGDERGSAPWASEGLACKGLAEVTRQWSERPPVAIVWQGYAEANFGMVGPTQQGLLAVLVARGDEVAAGASLFAQDAMQTIARPATRPHRRRGNWSISRKAASRPKSSRLRPIWRMHTQLCFEPWRTWAEARRCYQRGMPRSQVLISFGLTNCRHRPRSNRCRRRSLNRGLQWDGKARSRHNVRRWRPRAQRWRWPALYGPWRCVRARRRGSHNQRVFGSRVLA